MAFDDLPMSSVVYMGRGSFRMEAIATDAELGIAQPITGVVTSPLHSKPRGASLASAPEIVTRTRTSFEWRTPEPQALFGSQDNLPLLAAPTGVEPAAPARRFVTLPRAAVVGLAGAVFACGLLAGGAARSITVTGPASVAAAAMEHVVSPVVSPVVAPATPPTIEVTEMARPTPSPAAMPAAPDEAAAPIGTIDVPVPVKISAHKKAAAHHEPTVQATNVSHIPDDAHVSELSRVSDDAPGWDDAKAPAPAKAAPKPWVDPFMQ